MKIINSGKARNKSPSVAGVIACSLAALLAARAVTAGAGHGAELRGENRSVRAQLAMLEKATSGFNSYDVAGAAGWNAVISECVSSPEGAMGFHVANMEALEGAPSDLTLLKPEVLLYAPLADGSMEFLGVEYIVPYTPDNASNPPEILGQKLEYNPHQGVNGIWALHVWIERDNPLGIFAPFNPEVECPSE